MVEPPASVRFDQIVDAAEGKRPSKVDAVYRYPNLWTPGTEDESFTDEELDGDLAEPVAGLAIFNADTTTGVDPSLHFVGGRGLPCDDKYRGDAPRTKLEALAETQQKFARQHPRPS